jgi:hypothetical protein
LAGLLPALLLLTALIRLVRILISHSYLLSRALDINAAGR